MPLDPMKIPLVLALIQYLLISILSSISKFNALVKLSAQFYEML